MSAEINDILRRIEVIEGEISWGKWVPILPERKKRLLYEGEVIRINSFIGFLEDNLKIPSRTTITWLFNKCNLFHKQRPIDYLLDSYDEFLLLIKNKDLTKLVVDKGDSAIKGFNTFIDDFNAKGQE
jgi:hypothetical protein